MIDSRICPICERPFTPRKPTSKTCSRRCANTLRARETAEQRGALLRNRGEGKTYRKRGGRHKHRAVAEQILGRALRPGEVVHHRNGDKRDNRPENLEVLTSQGEHARAHRRTYVCQVAGCAQPHIARGLCRTHYNQTRRKGVMP